jgi:hypothetical protein
MNDSIINNSENNMGNIEYKRRLLYFLDILGFRDLLERNTAREVYKTISGFMDETANFMKIPGVSVIDTDILTFNFSDLIVTIVDYDIESKLDLFAALAVAINRLSRIQLYLLSFHGILIRGSIVCGDIFYDKKNNILYGPALVEAYQLESKSIVYPRIGISNNIIDELGGDQLFSKQLPNPYDPVRLGIFNDDEAMDERAILTVIYLHNLMNKDKDDIYFVDYLRVAFHLEEEEDYLNLIKLHMRKMPKLSYWKV